MRTQTIKLTTEQLAELKALQDSRECTKNELTRVQAILLVDQASSPSLIKELTGFNQKYAFDLRRKYLQRGISSLHDRKKQPKALLTRGQREKVIQIVTTSTPQAFGYETDYWTTAILSRIIQEHFGVTYKSRTSLYIIFKQAKFTYHKPDKQYKKRDQQVIDKWIAEQTPVLQKAFNDPNSVVLVEDEMFLSTQTTTQKIWLPQGEYPKIDVASTRKTCTIYGFLNVRTGQEHAFKAAGANSEESCRILDLIGSQYPGKTIVLVWDNAPWHKSATLKEYLTNTKHSFHLIQFPPYSPDLNPQEHVWKAGRSNITHNKFIENIDHATHAFIHFLNHQTFAYNFLTLV